MRLIPAFTRRALEGRPGLARIMGNVGWLSADKLVRLGLGLLVGVWIARHLGPEDFGLLSYAAAFVAIFGIVGTLGLPSIVVRDLVKDPEGQGTTLGTAAALHLAGGLAAFALAVAAIGWARPDDPLVRLAVVILGSALVLRATDVVVYWFEARVRSKYVVWTRSGVFVVFAAVKVALILAGAPVLHFVWALLAEAAVSALALLAVYLRRGPSPGTLRVRWGRATRILGDAWPLALAGIAVGVYMKIDKIMLGQMIGNEAVGVYSVAVRLSEVWYFIPMTIVASVFPAIVEAKRQGEALYHRRLQELYDLMVLLALAVAVPMTFLSGWLIMLLFGAAYQAAGPVLAIHIWAALFVFLGVASGKWFIVEDRQILSLQRTAAGAAVNVALNLVLIPRFGVVGAAWATVLSYALAGMFFDILQPPTRGMYRMKLRSLNLVRAARRVSNSYR